MYGLWVMGLTGYDSTGYKGQGTGYRQMTIGPFTQEKYLLTFYKSCQ